MRKLGHWLFGVAIALLAIVQIMPNESTRLNFLTQQNNLFSSFGFPFGFYVVHSVRASGSAEPAVHGRYFDGALLGMHLLVLGAVAGAWWYASHVGSMKARWRILLFVPSFLLGCVGMCWVRATYDPWGILVLQRVHDTKFKEDSLALLEQWTDDPKWIESRRELVVKQTRDTGDKSGVGDHFIFMTNGEWVAYCQACTKENPLLSDMFIGKGSDGRWYYTDFHFCIQMLEAHELGPYPHLHAFVDHEWYRIRTYDHKPDKSELRPLPRHHAEPCGKN